MFLEYHLPTLQKRQTHQGPAGEVLAEERWNMVEGSWPRISCTGQRCSVWHLILSCRLGEENEGSLGVPEAQETGDRNCQAPKHRTSGTNLTKELIPPHLFQHPSQKTKSFFFIFCWSIVDSSVRKIPWGRDWLPTPVFFGFPRG